MISDLRWTQREKERERERERLGERERIREPALACARAGGERGERARGGEGTVGSVFGTL